MNEDWLEDLTHEQYLAHINSNHEQFENGRTYERNLIANSRWWRRLSAYLSRRWYVYKTKRYSQAEFEHIMKLLKANNDGDFMTPAMWLIYEDAYYEKGYSGLSKWKGYLKSRDKNG